MTVLTGTAGFRVPVIESGKQTSEALLLLLKQIAASMQADCVAVSGAERLEIEGSGLIASLNPTGEAVSREVIDRVAQTLMTFSSKKTIYHTLGKEQSPLSEVDQVQALGIEAVAAIPLGVTPLPDACLIVIWIRKRELAASEYEDLVFYGRLVGVLCTNMAVIKTSQEQATRLSALVELSTTIHSSLNYQSVLQKVIDLATFLVSASHSTVYLLNQENKRLSPLLTNARTGRDRIMYRELTVGRGTEGKAAQSGEGVIVNGLSAENDGLPEVDGGSKIAVPLTFSGETIGVLSVHRGSGELFALEDLQFLSIFARQAADVIENARMFRDLQEAYDRLSRTQQQMVETEKLRVLGEMACGVAHDFNNNLGAILGRTELLKRKATDPELLKGLEEIERLALKGAETVKRTQEFARVRSKTIKKRVVINDVVRNAIETTRPLWKDQAQLNLVEVEVVTDLKATNPIAGSADELVDALANIIQNSFEALTRGGKIGIRTFDRGEEVVVEVEDNGVGMSSSVREKMFYPFFSSKGKGKTGLGLSVAYGALTRHSAAVEVKSEEGVGTCITMILAARPELAERSSSRKTPMPDLGALRVLLIDDDAPLLKVVSELLHALGHKVETAAEGIEALAKFDGGGFEMVITDLGLPGMSGWDIADAVRLKAPAIPVMLISGWGSQITDADAALHQVDVVLSKPFTLVQLRESIAVAREKRLSGAATARQATNAR
jgi:signal transduction histidine kinase/CheY-like chemotaxis protein